MKKKLGFLFLILLGACAEAPSKKVAELIPPHGGVLLRGTHYHVEIVSKAKKVEIYTLQELETGVVKVIPTSSSKVYARYRPERSHGNWGLPLTQDEIRYMGKVDPRGESSYKIFVDLKVGETKEKYDYTIVMKD